MQRESVAADLPLVELVGCREAQPRAVRPSERPDADVHIRRRLQGHGCAVAGDGESLDEYSASLHRFFDLEVELVAPGLVSVGEDYGLGDDRGHHQQEGGHDRHPAPARSGASALQRLGHVAGPLTALSALAPLAEPGVGSEGHPPVAAVPVLAVLLAHPAKDSLRPLRHQAQGAGAGLDGLDRRGAARSSRVGRPARRRPALPACTSRGRRPPGAVFCHLSFRRPSRFRPARTRRQSAILISDGPTGA